MQSLCKLQTAINAICDLLVIFAFKNSSLFSVALLQYLTGTIVGVLHFVMW